MSSYGEFTVAEIDCDAKVLPDANRSVVSGSTVQANTIYIDQGACSPHQRGKIIHLQHLRLCSTCEMKHEIPLPMGFSIASQLHVIYKEAFDRGHRIAVINIQVACSELSCHFDFQACVRPPYPEV